MVIAVACEGLEVSSHVSHCSSFMCYTVERGIITECRNMPNPGLSLQETAELMRDMYIDTLIAGKIDSQLAELLCHAGIDVMTGAYTTAHDAAEAYLNRTLIGADSLCSQILQDDSHDKETEQTFTALDKYFCALPA